MWFDLELAGNGVELMSQPALHLQFSAHSQPLFVISVDGYAASTSASFTNQHHRHDS